MTTRANVAETKFLEMSAQQSSSKSYSKPTAEKDVLISSGFEQRPTPKVCLDLVLCNPCGSEKYYNYRNVKVVNPQLMRCLSTLFALRSFLHGCIIVHVHMTLHKCTQKVKPSM